MARFRVNLQMKGWGESVEDYIREHWICHKNHRISYTSSVEYKYTDYKPNRMINSYT